MLDRVALNLHDQLQHEIGIAGEYYPARPAEEERILHENIISSDSKMEEKEES